MSSFHFLPSPRNRILSVFLLAFLFSHCGPKAGGPITSYSGKVRVRQGGFVQEFPMEEYLVGVLAREVSENWPLEALKAQAVASRTYAARRMREAKAAGKSFDLAADVSHQAYSDASAVPEGSPFRLAVEQTQGEILCDGLGYPIEAAFHSTCGGRTESAAAVWTRDLPYLQSVECNWCGDSPHFFWQVDFEESELLAVLRTLGVQGNSLHKFEVTARTSSGRASVLAAVTDVGEYEIQAKDLREAIGDMRLKSLLFQVSSEEGGLTHILGSGFGHGVGMCQWGAKGFALEGAGYKKILKTYYPSAKPCRIGVPAPS